ncbi:hypothetical protein BTJ40_08980 [Microbulbifer sp. A4B17]|uniref:hypothetical protein n=1 Tax=Microbulbifer sp. A4B17 TaxID=359370 RepID=UPI000D52EC62|nr:hypothetical protein [Microbulbifer sp. A4B17]AWF80932.1 hypothetical protein BTJ40_08980 [Microbulbifer sp. A4B17]
MGKRYQAAFLGLISITANAWSLENNYSGSGIVVEGAAKVKTENLFSCATGRSRLSPVGTKEAESKEFTVPAEVNYYKQYFATDLYNQCSGVAPSSLKDVNLATVPVVDIDQEGEVVTGYIFADNYFELYINGKLVAVDPVPFTPFNSSVVKFRVNKPYDIAVKAVDWEENSGEGTESNRGVQSHPGDGGFIASFSDGTTTSSKWHAQTFYTAPIYDLGCVKERGEERSSSDCAESPKDPGAQIYSLHWNIPENWKVDNKYLSWPFATEYTERQIGVDNKNAYMNFRDQFYGSGAKFIWSKNIVLDNLVLLRYRVE